MEIEVERLLRELQVAISSSPPEWTKMLAISRRLVAWIRTKEQKAALDALPIASGDDLSTLFRKIETAFASGPDRSGSAPSEPLTRPAAHTIVLREIACGAVSFL